MVEYKLDKTKIDSFVKKENRRRFKIFAIVLLIIPLQSYVMYTSYKGLIGLPTILFSGTFTFTFVLVAIYLNQKITYYAAHYLTVIRNRKLKIASLAKDLSENKI